jgi:hypothetical protein
MKGDANMYCCKELFPLDLFYYPDDINILNRLYDVVGACGSELECLFSPLPEFVKIWRPRDGRWFWVAEFSVDEGRIVRVFFPWCQNRSGKIRLDESIVFYGVQKEKIIVIFEKIVNIFWEKYFLRSYHNPGRKLPNNEIFSRTLSDGRKVVPAWYVDVRAYLNPIENGFFSHLAAKKWFEEQGYEII